MLSIWEIAVHAVQAAKSGIPGSSNIGQANGSTAFPLSQQGELTCSIMANMP